MIRQLLAGTIVIMVLFMTECLNAAALKKVLILDFVNTTGKADYKYLESSITGTVRSMLSERFAFREPDRSSIEEVSAENQLYREDFNTKSVAMNMGLLAKQDVVISGGFAVDANRANPVISTRVRILNVATKNVIADFKMDGPADNRIFTTIQDISRRIADEAKTVLPNKADWAKSGMADDSDGGPWFNRVSLGIRAGGAIYNNGWAEYFEPDLPLMGLSLRANVPVIWERLALEADMIYMTHSLKDGAATRVQSLELQGKTTNLMAGLYASVDIHLFWKLGLHPALGGGYVYQSTEVTGQVNSNFSNSFPFAGAGVDISYKINRTLSFVLSEKNIMEIENGVYTYVFALSTGVRVIF